MAGFTPWLFLLYFLQVLKQCEAVTPGTCADMMYLENRQTIDHGHVKTVTGNNKTGMLLRETISSADNNIYFAYVSPICKMGNLYRYNCLALKTFPNYADLARRNSEYCYDNDIRINAECRMASLRIINGFLFCELEPGLYSTKPRIAKISITTGQIIKTRELTDATTTTLCLKTRETAWNPGATAHLGEVTVHILVDGTETWLLYASASKSGKSIVEQIRTSDLATIETKVIDKIDRRDHVLMICGKLYVMAAPWSDRTLSLKKAVDIYNTKNVMTHKVRLVENLPASAFVSWIHYNPKLEQVFIGVVNSNSFIYKVVTCKYNYPDTRSLDFTKLKSTFLWSLEANEPEQKTDMVDTLVSYFKIRNVTELDSLANNLLVCPPKSCAFDLNTPTKQYCRIKFAISTLKIYSDYKHLTPKSSKMLQIHFHMDKLLNQQNFKHMSNQIYLLKDYLSKSFMELKQKVNGYRTTIGSYFTSLADFDRSTAKSDMNLMYDYLGRFKNRTEEITSGLQKKIKILVNEAEASAGAEILGKTNLVIMAGLAFANPIESALDTVGSILALYNAIDELMVASATLSKVLSLKKYLPRMKEMASNMSAKIKENSKTYSAVMEIASRAYKGTLDDEQMATYAADFLKQYDSYEPGYLPSTIAEIESMYDEMVEELCNVVFAGETTPSAIAQSVFYSRGNCFNTKLEVKSLMAIYYDMYDKQDDLFDAFRSAVRANIAKHNAERIKQLQNEVDEDKLEWTHVNLKVFTMELFISSEVHRLVLVHEACNLIKYKNANVMPDFCKNTIIFPHGAYFDKVVSYRYEEDMCGSDRVEKYVNVPAMEQLHGVDLPNGTIDLIALYQGKETSFKIPDKQWLIQNGWIRSSDDPKMIVLRNFELYLPMFQNTSTVTPVSVRSSIRYSGNNVASPGGVSYYFNDPNKYIYNFRYGQKQQSCDSEVTDNLPYSVPGCTKPESICISSRGTVTNAALYPSIYSRWYISAHVSGNLLQPKPKGNFNLIASVALCYIRPAVITRDADVQRNPTAWRKQTEENFDDKRSVPVCCATSGKYHDWLNSANPCQSCPTNSTSELNGYFCQMI